MRVSSRLLSVLLVPVLGSALVASAAVSATGAQGPAAPPGPRQMVNAVPSTATPAVTNGDVRSIAKVGSTMVIGGTFTAVAGQTRNRLAMFNQSNGALTSVNVSVGGPVYSVLPGPSAGTVYVGGNFDTIGGVARRDLALVNTSTGAVVTSFVPPLTDFGWVNDLVLRGSRLYVAGTFSKLGGKNHAGIGTLNGTSGALDAFMNVQFTDRHNDSGSGAQGWKGPVAIDVTPDGRQVVVIGNFKRADGLLRDQVAVLDTSGATARVRPDWSTNRYAPYCFKNAFDSYVRGVSLSPDGSYFVVGATGGGVEETLCDAAARFELTSSGTNIQPTWVDETGGDTNWAVEVTDNAVFVGGHQRWANNPYGHDNARPGAVPRPGLVALDPLSGRPLQWNPGRNPPGVTVYAILGTSEGVYVTSNTDWVGNRKYKRQKVAFFPYAGGLQLASSQIGSLPGRVYLSGAQQLGGSSTLASVNLDGNGRPTGAMTSTGKAFPSNARGAFSVGGTLFYGSTSSTMIRRTFDGTTLGAESAIDPYHDPVWRNVSNNLGGTFDGATPTLYAQYGSVTASAFSQGRMLYTRSGDARLHTRWFSADSGIMDERVIDLPTSVSFSDVNGMFVAGNRLLYARTSTRALYSVAFNGAAVTGSPTQVSGPGVDGIDWRNTTLFLGS